MITLNTLNYVQDTNLSADKVKYVGPSNTFSVKDHILLSRTAPKPTSTFAGVAKAEAKRIKTVTLADGSQYDAYFTLSAALPVGISDADADALLNDLADFGLTADAQNLFRKHDIIV